MPDEADKQNSAPREPATEQPAPPKPTGLKAEPTPDAPTPAPYSRPEPDKQPVGQGNYRAVAPQPDPNDAGSPARPQPDQPIADLEVAQGLARQEENPSQRVPDYQLDQAAASPGPVKGDEQVGTEATTPSPSRPSDQEPGNQVGIQGTTE